MDLDTKRDATIRPLLENSPRDAFGLAQQLWFIAHAVLSLPGALQRKSQMSTSLSGNRVFRGTHTLTPLGSSCVLLGQRRMEISFCQERDLAAKDLPNRRLATT